jgi:hypothetical protein
MKFRGNCRRLQELAGGHKRFGYRRLPALLRRAGIEVTDQRAYRLYSEASLAVQAAFGFESSGGRGLELLFPLAMAISPSRLRPFRLNPA